MPNRRRSGYPNPLSVVRETHGKQVLSVEQLHVGHFYVEHTRSGEERILLIELMEDNAYRYLILNFGSVRTGYLQDVNVVPYDNGMWNTANYLTVTRRTPIAVDKLEAYVLKHSKRLF